MKNLLSLGRSLTKNEQKEISGGEGIEFHVVFLTNPECEVGKNDCPSGEICDVASRHCVTAGSGGDGGGICPDNIGQNCNSAYDLI
ncbi:MAG: hypothetical protein MK202_03975 [Tenacibaculum sp.]|nr:hypothetical protein [Tenacibaculum sp.]